MNTENSQPTADVSYLMGVLADLDGTANRDALVEIEEVKPEEIEHAVAAGLVELFEENGERGVRVTSRGADLYDIG